MRILFLIAVCILLAIVAYGAIAGIMTRRKWQREEKKAQGYILKWRK